MGQRYSAILLILFLFTGIFAGLCGQQLDSASVQVRSLRLPQYKDNILQYIFYIKSMRNQGNLIFLNDLIVDTLHNDWKPADIPKVTVLNSVQPYPLDAKQSDINDFWKSKIHCQALIFSDTAEIDKNKKMIRSDKPVKIRSTFLDADGVGFDIDLEEKNIHIRSKVKIRLNRETREKALDTQDKNTATEIKKQ